MVAQVQDLGLGMITAALHAHANRPRHLQWGVGSGQGVDDTDIADKTGTTEARTAGTSAQATTTTANDTYRVTGTITAAGARAITEVGVFDAAGAGSPPAGGNMGMYGDFAVINLDAGDSIAFQFDTVFDQA